MCSLNDVLLSLLLLYPYFCDQIVMGPFDCEHNLLATARERSNKHCLLEKRSIDEQVTLFPRGHSASWHVSSASVVGQLARSSAPRPLPPCPVPGANDC